MLKDLNLNMKFVLKIVFVIFGLLIVSGCERLTNETANDTSSILKIESIEVLKDSLILNGNEGIWYYKSKPFLGYSVNYFPNKVLRAKVGFYQGKKQGVAKTWFDDGSIKTVCFYEKNMLEGLYKAWWRNGILASKSTYVNGFKQGEEKTWYNSGKLAKQRNLVNGLEHGLQKAWLRNGKLYVNYEAKNGRIFGMRRANSCYRLENETLTVKAKL